jgi:hypothetical protein
LSKIADALNSALTAAFDVFLLPFQSLAPIWGLLAVSLVSGVLFLLIYGRVSNQAGLKRVKGKIYGYLLESVLYRRDIGLSLKAQAKMFLSAFVYLGYALPPIVILAVPCLLILAQLNLRYEARSPLATDRLSVRIKVANAQTLQHVALSALGAIEVSPPVRVLPSGEAYWGLKTRDQLAQASLTFKVGDETLYTELPLKGPGSASPLFYSKSAFWRLLYPGAIPLQENSLLSEIQVCLPSASYRFLGFKLHWLVVFFVFSMLSGLAAAKVFRVEI